MARRETFEDSVGKVLSLENDLADPSEVDQPEDESLFPLAGALPVGEKEVMRSADLLRNLLTRDSVGNEQVVGEVQALFAKLPMSERTEALLAKVESAEKAEGERGGMIKSGVKKTVRGLSQMEEDWNRVLRLVAGGTATKKQAVSARELLRLQVEVYRVTIAGDLFGKLVSRAVQDLETLLRMQ